MSRVDAALRHARDRGVTAPWQNLTPAVDRSSRELERLPTEMTSSDAQPPAPFRRINSESHAEWQFAKVDPTVAAQLPVSLPASLASTGWAQAVPVPESVDKAPARNKLGSKIDVAVSTDSVGLDAIPINPDPVAEAPKDDLNAMFEALDRVLARTPLTSPRRGGRASDVRSSRPPNAPASS